MRISINILTTSHIKSVLLTHFLQRHILDKFIFRMRISLEIKICVISGIYR